MSNARRIPCFFAYSFGQKVCSEGLSRDVNPHVYGTDKYKDWLLGYECREREFDNAYPKTIGVINE